tara:strand:+ start:1776 stop:2528 length:753 start_codon:yes stop_codon:yes gene_type:complete
MIELLLIAIPLIYYLLMIFINFFNIRNIIKLNNQLNKNKVFIITDNYCKCNQKKHLFLGLYYYSICDLCKITNVIDHQKKDHIDYLISNMKPNSELKLILNTSSIISKNIHLLCFLIKKNNIKLTCYIDKHVYGSAIFLALLSRELNYNWYSRMKPIENNIKYDENSDKNYYDEKYKVYFENYNDLSYLIDTLFNNSSCATKIKKKFTNTNLVNIYYDFNDIKKIKSNIAYKNNIPEEIKEINQSYENLL